MGMRGLRAAAAAGALIGVTAAIAWAAATDDVPTAVPRASLAASAPVPERVEVATPARHALSVVTPEAPTAVRLPSGLSVPVLAVSTEPDGRLAVPEDIRLGGWWRGGSRIGDPFGSTVIAAHVDSKDQGLGPFAELLSVRADQRITVGTAHLRQEFTVRSLRLVRSSELGNESWVFSADGERRLTLVTCAPPYDEARGGYQNLAVVTATPVRDATVER
jgi:Sortase domain